MSAQTAPRVAPSTPHVAEASCLARESAAAAAAGKATNSVDTSECGHHFYPASSSVVRFAKPAANVVKGSRRQRKQVADNARRSGMVFEAMKDVARRAEFDSTSDDDGAALAASGTFRKGRDIDECSEDGTPTEAEILEALACEYDDFGDW